MNIFPNSNSYNKDSNWVFWYRLYNVNGALGKRRKGDDVDRGPQGEDGLKGAQGEGT